MLRFGRFLLLTRLGGLTWIGWCLRLKALVLRWLFVISVSRCVVCLLVIVLGRRLVRLMVTVMLRLALRIGLFVKVP